MAIQEADGVILGGVVVPRSGLGGMESRDMTPIGNLREESEENGTPRAWSCERGLAAGVAVECRASLG